MTLPTRPPAELRHHRLPPPLLDPGDGSEGQGLLEEHSEALALVLWKTSRSTRLLVASPAAGSDLFGADSISRRLSLIRDSGADEGVRGALVAAAESTLVEVDGARLAGAMLTIAEWGLHTGARGTALEFFQLAALLDERSAGPCREAGKLARMRGDLPRAEMWFRHGIHRGRTGGDWASATWSMIGLAAVLRLRGSLPGAETWLMRALRRARRHSLHEVVAAAYHDLVVVGIRRQSNRAVVRFGGQAIQAYGDDPRALALAHDIAAFWMMQGFHAEALEVFRSIPVDFGTPSDRLALAANTARCAGSLRLRSEFDAAMARTESLLDDPAARQMEALALGAAAQGAAEMGETAPALALATRALEAARLRSEAQVEREMEELVAALGEGTRAAGAEGVEPAARAPRPVSVLAREISVAIAG